MKGEGSRGPTQGWVLVSYTAVHREKGSKLFSDLCHFVGL